jgi:hypothetical protein
MPGVRRRGCGRTKLPGCMRMRSLQMYFALGGVYLLLCSAGVVAVPQRCHDCASEARYQVYECVGPRYVRPSPLAVTEVHNFRGEEWWRSLEVEVQNVSGRPVYSFGFIIELPDTCAAGRCYGLVQRYGRARLLLGGEHPAAEDIPLMPGEVYSFNVPAVMRPTFMNRPPELRRAALFKFGRVIFGDGTGVEAGGSPLSPLTP